MFDTERVPEVVVVVWFLLVQLDAVLVVQYSIVDLSLHVVAVGQVILDFVVHLLLRRLFVELNGELVVFDQVEAVRKADLGLVVRCVELDRLLIIFGCLFAVIALILNVPQQSPSVPELFVA